MKKCCIKALTSLSRHVKAVIVQNKNKIVKALQSADIIFIAIATSEVPGVENKVNILPKSWNSGAPGGCPTSNL